MSVSICCMGSDPAGLTGATRAGLGTTIIARWQMRLTQALERRKFHVETYREDVGHIDNDFTRATNNVDVWGYALFGHGYRKITLWTDWTPDPEFSAQNGGMKWGGNVILPDEFGRYFRYGLGINYHCFAALQPAWSNKATIYYGGGTGMIHPLAGPREYRCHAGEVIDYE